MIYHSLGYFSFKTLKRQLLQLKNEIKIIQQQLAGIVLLVVWQLVHTISVSL